MRHPAYKYKANRPATILKMAAPITRKDMAQNKRKFAMVCPKKTKGQLKPYIGCKGILFFDKGGAKIQMCHSHGKRGSVVSVKSPEDASKKVRDYCKKHGGK